MVYTFHLFKLSLATIPRCLRFPSYILIVYNYTLRVLYILREQTFYKYWMIIRSHLRIYINSPAVERVVNSLITILTLKNIVLLLANWISWLVWWILWIKFFNINFILCYYGPIILENVLCVIPFEICWRLLRRIYITIYFIYQLFLEIVMINFCVLEISKLVNGQFLIFRNLIFIIFSPPVILSYNRPLCYFKCRIIWWILVMCVNCRRLNWMIHWRAESFIIIL